MKKIRICYPFVGDSIGGSHLSSIELIKKLDKKKFEAIPLLHKKDILYPHLINEGLKPQFLKLDDFVGKKKGLLRNLIIIFKNILKITPYINKKNIDIIHFLTSENEGFNRTIVEGMLSKIPVVAVDSGAHKEIIKNNFNGWLVKRNNLRELTNISIKILNLKKKDLKKIIFRAEKFAKKNFNVRNHVNRISKIYFEAMF